MKPYNALFSMDCFDDSQPHIEGLTYGYTWNGWACPYFTKENGLLIADLMNKDREWCIDNQCPVSNLFYSEEKDCFIFVADETDPEDIQDPQIFEATVIDGVKYYGIGNCSWCWYEMQESEAETWH